MKRFFKYVSFVAISIALATACEKADESALPNIPLKLSTDEGNTKAVVLNLEKGKTFPKAQVAEQIKGIGSITTATTKVVAKAAIIKAVAKVVTTKVAKAIKILHLQVLLSFRAVVITV